MADTTEGDTDVLYLGLLVLALTALIAGLVIHSFIIGVNVSDWWRGRSVTPVDHIVTSLGVSRLCSQSAFTIGIFLENIFLQNVYSRLCYFFIDTVSIFFSYVNVWSTSLLSIVLCLKISNLHTRLFLYLRRMILHRTGYFYIVLLLISAFSSLMPLVMDVIEEIKIKPLNETMNNFFKSCNFTSSFYNYLVGGIIPHFFYFISSVFLFVSLYHHTTRMKMSSNLSINLETYYSVMRFVSCTFVYNTVYFGVDFVCLFYYCVYCVNLPGISIVLEFLPVLHSSYMICRTAKLRNRMSKVLQNQFLGVPHTGTQSI
ncbi:hypothetical protein GDO81_010634 [Engystomops pustulosus]|uniref:Taste receptor type 2 n=1 Tax=Engystomops pustulosus TaxID=76066 RepID=A0AAV7C2A0_ENGPU|nr:hypothetical protein GDO81_010634 [Engystomops pustulosus]